MDMHSLSWVSKVEPENYKQKIYMGKRRSCSLVMTHLRGRSLLQAAAAVVAVAAPAAAPLAAAAAAWAGLLSCGVSLGPLPLLQPPPHRLLLLLLLVAEGSWALLLPAVVNKQHQQ
jgi:hypothetical protein